MTLVVAGSVATDHLMTYYGLIREQIVADKLDRISLSFLAEDLHVRRGGVAANICFGLGSLGVPSVMLGAVGADFDDYRAWLDNHGVDTSHVLVCEDLHTARFVCTTDSEQNQIASFHPGAMSRAREIDLAAVVAAVGRPTLVVVSPDDPGAMLRHTEACRALGIPFAADPSQQVSNLDGDSLRQLIGGARFLFTNDYERELLQKKTGWTESEIAERVECWVTTHGADGISIERCGEERITVAVVPPVALADPTGVGDAFRAGFLAGVSHGLPLDRSAMLGAAVATTVLETTGTQEYTLDHARLVAQLTDTYGADAADEVVRPLSLSPALEGTR